jgi:hypothetical protein
MNRKYVEKQTKTSGTGTLKAGTLNSNEILMKMSIFRL